MRLMLYLESARRQRIVEILNIHFNALRIMGRLSQSLCSAIDGTLNQGNDIGCVSAKLEWGRKRRALKRATEEVIGY
jgi:hypothetical protein